MTDDQAQGQWDQAKGKVKEEVGKATGDRSTEESGKLDQLKGNVEEKVGDAKESMHDADNRDR
jgi:uncharacterized protein YjbJ (UPF0337 family)